MTKRRKKHKKHHEEFPFQALVPNERLVKILNETRADIGIDKHDNVEDLLADLKS